MIYANWKKVYFRSIRIRCKKDIFFLILHSSQFQGLCLIKNSSEMLVEIDQAFIRGKNKEARNEKRKKNTMWDFVF